MSQVYCVCVHVQLHDMLYVYFFWQVLQRHSPTLTTMYVNKVLDFFSFISNIDQQRNTYFVTVIYMYILQLQNICLINSYLINVLLHLLTYTGKSQVIRFRKLCAPGLIIGAPYGEAWWWRRRRHHAMRGLVSNWDMEIDQKWGKDEGSPIQTSWGKPTLEYMSKRLCDGSPWSTTLNQSIQSKQLRSGFGTSLSLEPDGMVNREIVKLLN